MKIDIVIHFIILLFNTLRKCFIFCLRQCCYHFFHIIINTILKVLLKRSRIFVGNDSVQNFDIFLSTNNFLCPYGENKLLTRNTNYCSLQERVMIYFPFKVGFRVTLLSSHTISSCLWNRKKGIEKWKRSYIIATHMPDPK